LIIGEDSPLRRLPAALDRKQMLFLDGIRYSVEMADLAHARLQQSLCRLTADQSSSERFDHLDALSAVQDAWSMVDSLHRLRGLIRQMPGFKQNTPNMRVFRQQTDKVEDLRNAVQHLNHEIDKLVGANQTVWGSLSWFASPWPDAGMGTIGLLVAGTVFTSEGHPMVNPAGKEMHGLVDLVTLTAYGHSLNLSNAMRHVEGLIKSMEDQSKEQFADHPTAAGELLLCAQVRFDGA
jgi:hypothetical protein